MKEMKRSTFIKTLVGGIIAATIPFPDRRKKKWKKPAVFKLEDSSSVKNLITSKDRFMMRSWMSGTTFKG